MQKSSSRGFTLIELLVVIAIIGILASVILASLSTARSKARDAKRLSELRQIQTALELYRNDKGLYPVANWNALASWNSGLTTALVNNNYLAAVPVDPGSSSIYRYYSNYPGTYTCNGVLWQEYEYVLTFDLENPNANVPDTNWTTNKKCLPGPRKVL